MSRVKEQIKKKEEKEDKINKRLYFVFMFMLTITLFIVIFMQYRSRRTYQAELNSISVEIAETQKKNEKLQKQSENLRNIEYLEKMAREKGYIKSNEIIFYEQ